MKDFLHFGYNITCNRYALPFIMSAILAYGSNKHVIDDNGTFTPCNDDSHSKPYIRNFMMALYFFNFLSQSLCARIVDYSNGKQSGYEAIGVALLSFSSDLAIHKVFKSLNFKGYVIEKSCHIDSSMDHNGTIYNLRIGGLVVQAAALFATIYTGDKTFRDMVNSGVGSVAECVMSRS